MTREQFIEQVAQSQEPLRRFLCVLCGGDSSRADDIAQEALLKAYLSFGRFEGKAKFSTWLFRIAYNCFYDHRQKASRNMIEALREESVPEDGITAYDAEKVAHEYVDESLTADRNFEHQQLYLAIDSLSCDEKAVVLLFYMEDKPIKDIEQITGMPSGTVRSHLSRARAHLRKFLSAMD
ncbi:MAG: sigma-70 family RNA polymerase sigma factor [Bacteroidales bacterium]|nr:sigma-70 family RNA polymerase sigma factor [Bacteroidales bacterium]